MAIINNDISNMVTNIIATIEEKHGIKFNENSVVKIITDEMQNHDFIYTPKNLSYNICYLDEANAYYITGLTYETDWIREVVSVIKERNKYISEKWRSTLKIYIDLLLKNGLNQRFYEVTLNNSIIGYKLTFISNKDMLTKDVLQFDKFFKYRIQRIEDSYILLGDSKRDYLNYLESI